MAAPEPAAIRTPGLAGVLVVVGLLIGAGMAGLALATAPVRPPQPDGVVDPHRGGIGRVLARSVPIAIEIPAIGVSAQVIATGVAPDGTIEVPPMKMTSAAGWYRYGPSPGEPGSAAIVGHVDSRSDGPGVFFKLGALRRGDVVEIRRDDGATAVFTVDGATLVPKERFPAGEIHARTGPARLALITCGGRFDPRARSYLDNVIVYASLSGLR